MPQNNAYCNYRYLKIEEKIVKNTDLKNGRSSPLSQGLFLKGLKRPWSYSFLGHQTSNPGIVPSRLVGDFRENICNLHRTGIDCQNTLKSNEASQSEPNGENVAVGCTLLRFKSEPNAFHNFRL